MLNYKQINLNPKNRKTGDCSTRALAACLSISYEDALKLQYEESLKCYYDPTSKQIMGRVLEKFGYMKMKQPRKEDGKKYLVKELDKIIEKKHLNAGVLVTVVNHHTCIYQDSVIDIWDCRNKACGNYYIKIRDEMPEDISKTNIHELLAGTSAGKGYCIK